MPGKKAPLPQVGELGDAYGMTRLVETHLEWMAVRGYTAATVRGREKALRVFLRWCAERELGRASEVTRPILERFQKHLHHWRKKDGQPLSLRSQRERLEAVRSFFRWCAKTNVTLFNPASELDLPRIPQHLPRQILTAKEVEEVLRQADVTTPLGVRDRAMLETLYSTGVRRLELTQLTLAGLDVERGTLMICEGKGRKDRVVPIGERALAWLRRYLVEIRPGWVREPDPGILFLGHEGDPLNEEYVTHLVGEYVEQAAVGKSGSCHLFRHTMATLMLENGADIRHVQAMLGHSKLETTAIYTQVAVGKLKAVHTATHPAERGSAKQGELAREGQESYDGDDEQRTEE